MNAAYIGILAPGTTSRMRAETLRELTPDWEWEWVDTAAPFHRTGRLGRSAAFRLMAGPAVRRINEVVRSAFKVKQPEVIWIDKGVFLWPATIAWLRGLAKRMIHFTPDTAFHENRSRHFERSLALYDLLVTTKSFEMEEYRRRVPEGKIHLTTQGYDRRLHFPRETGAVRRKEAVFVGLCEPDRERCLGRLLERGIPVRLGGQKWGRFLRRWERCPHLHFEGDRVFGEAYAALLSRSWVGLGLLSRRFPELHTTRTFEIPACGALLATENNRELGAFFSPSEALFVRDYDDLAVQLESLWRDEGRLARMADAGHARVFRDGRDYHTILGEILGQPGMSGAGTAGGRVLPGPSRDACSAGCCSPIGKPQ